ncbi:MAG TPA: hypothetical protein PKW95_08220 [bacterium]|mgnify:CR=1 FL=1|nr:hypothetical protein [bacterium]
MDLSSIKNPLSEIERETRYLKIFRRFGGLVDIDNAKEFAYALVPFIETRPLCYLNVFCFDSLLDFLESNIELTFSALSDLDQDITKAIQSLLSLVGRYDEEKIDLLQETGFLKMDTIWHPQYIFITEHIFNNLISLFLNILGKKLNKNYLDLTLTNKVDRLNANGLNDAVIGFNSNIRNAISHGKSIYYGNFIRYINEKENLCLHPSEVLGYCDNLLITCNTLLLIIIIFICRNQKYLNKSNLPLGIVQLVIKGYYEYADCMVQRVIESENINDTKQITIFFSSSSKSARVHLIDSFEIAKIIGKMRPLLVDRIVININCGGEIDNNIILRYNHKIANWEIETMLPWNGESKLLERIWMLKSVIMSTYSNYKLKSEISKEKIFNFCEYSYTIRKISRMDARYIRRISLEVVLNDRQNLNKEKLKLIICDIIDKHKNRYFRPLFGETKQLIPVRAHYIWINIYLYDSTLRKLNSLGWADGKLAKAELIRKNVYYNEPVHVRSYDEIHKKIRIQFCPGLYN